MTVTPRWLERLTVLSIAAAAVFSVSLAVAGIPILGNDSYNHLHWLTQFNELRQDGVEYPRWFGHSWSDFGAPTFYFYPPLTFFLINAVYTVSPGLLADTYFHIIQIFASIASVFTFYLFVTRTIAGKSSSSYWVSSLLYGFLTYRFVNMYVRGAIAEHLAFVWLPLLFLGIEIALDPSSMKRRLRGAYWIALMLAMIFITSVPILATLTVVLPVYVLLRVRSGIARTWPIALGGVFALGLSAFYALPAASFSSLIHRGMLFGQAANNFVLYNVLFVNQSNLYFMQAVFLMLAMVAAVLWWIARKESNGIAKAWLIVALLSVFVQIPFFSVPVWDVIPTLQYVQFGSRFNTYLTIALAISYLSITEFRLRRWLLGVLILMNLTTLLKPIKSLSQAFDTPRTATEGQVIQDGFEYFTNFAGPDPFKNQAFTIDHYRSPEIFSMESFDSLSGVTVVGRKSNETTFQVSVATPTPVRFHRYYWPNWQLVTNDGRIIPLAPDSIGLLTATLPAGAYTATLEIARSDVERNGVLISLTTLLLTLGLGVGSGLRRVRQE